MFRTRNTGKGFTLLELLIVIAIIAILSVILIFVLNPAETLRKSRDSQRMSDLGTVKTAISLYMTSKTTPFLGGAATNVPCKGTGAWGANDKIFYSYPSDAPGAAITDTSLDGSTVAGFAGQVTNANLANIDGTGWLPVDLSSITGGSPISNMPVDPVNTITDPAALSNADMVYRYACRGDGAGANPSFEIASVLESQAFTIDDNRMTKDGGNNVNYFESGTDLTILGAGTDF